jgi:anti-sigma factor RsiW
MNCAEFEGIVADYLDGTLTQEERTAVEDHAATCSSCSEFLSDVSGGLGVLQAVEAVEPPGELITRIAYLAPRGATRDPFEKPGFLARLSERWLMPVLQPRLAMGMAMTILSFAMLVRCTGVQVQRVRPADLSPLRMWANVEDKAIRVKDQTVKYYENLRIVYEVESHLKDLEEPSQTSSAPNVSAKPNSQASPTGRPKQEGSKK